MSVSRWRPKLRSRITIALVAVAVGVAATTAGALVWNARSIILESKQEAIYDVLRAEAKATIASLPSSPGAGDLAAAAEGFSQPSLLINLRTDVSVGSLSVDIVPRYVLDGVRGEGMTAYERTSPSGNLQFMAGLSMRAGTSGDGDLIGVIGVFDMRGQQDEIDALVRLGMMIGAVFVLAAASVGLAVGRQLGRPLQTLVEVADGLGNRVRVPVDDTAYPDVNAVLEAMRNSADRLDATIAQLEQSEATARQLVADVAHELRTPLATIVAVSDILADTEAATVGDRSAAGGIAARSATHLTALTNDILEMSRFDSGRSEVVSEPVDIGALWRELEELRQWAGVAFEVFGDPLVRTDVLRLKLILTNLVTNALRHGEPPVEVRIWVEEGRLTIAVTDSGPGVAPEHEAKVFGRFYKANAARSNSESSGLGLAIVRENARVLGGDAWLSQQNGTVFAVWIPLANHEPSIPS